MSFVVGLMVCGSPLLPKFRTRNGAASILDVAATSVHGDPLPGPLFTSVSFSRAPGRQILAWLDSFLISSHREGIGCEAQSSADTPPAPSHQLLAVPSDSDWLEGRRYIMQRDERTLILSTDII